MGTKNTVTKKDNVTTTKVDPATTIASATDTLSKVDVPKLTLEVTGVTASAAAAREATTLTVTFKMNSDASLKDKCDFVGVDLPSGWGPVLRNGPASMGAVTLTGALANGTALNP